MLNDIPALLTARLPRGIVKINDEILTGWVSWDVDNNTFYQADTFSITFAANERLTDRGPLWWSQQTEVFAEIFGGFPANVDNFNTVDLSSLLYGRVDEIAYDPVAAEIVLTGRDLTSVFIDTKTTEKWPNLTSSQIAVQLATKYQLKPVVTATTVKTGRYYDIDHVTLTDERSEWDLLTYLAQQEQFIVYVSGKELHFEPKASATDEPYLLKWEAPTADRAHPIYNGTHISFTRDLTVAKGITVTIRSWNQKSKKSFTVAYPKNSKSIGAGKSSPVGANQNYTYTFANLTPELALQKAIALHKERSNHEVKLSATLPADNILSGRNVIQVIGTNTKYDQIYYPDSIRRQMSFSNGYTMTVTAKNHSPENEVSV